jgi:perosamine synthetase
MGIEERVRESFRNLKKDISEIKNSIGELSTRFGGQEESKILDKDGRIFTAKPFVNNDMKKAILDVMDSGIFSMGEKVKEFEEKFANFTKAGQAIAVCNGTVAIEIALEALGIKRGDEIIVPSNTTMPTIEPVLKLGGIPVFVDIDERNYTLDPRGIKKAITDKTRAVMPVHLYGNAVDLKAIKKICDDHGLFLIEDCAQAHNALYDGKHVGTIGDVGCFSFYPTKNMSVLGEGGMIITNNSNLGKKIRMLINHGEDGRYNHVIPGGNYRLGEMQCAIGIKQLELLDKFTDRRREIAEIYNKLLKSKKLILPKEQKNSRHVYHLYVIRVSRKRRDKIIEQLREEGIFLGVHYPIPCHKQKAIGDGFSLPVTERVVEEIISLPTYPQMTDRQVRKVAESLMALV